jgi:hypothetical protein
MLRNTVLNGDYIKPENDGKLAFLLWKIAAAFLIVILAAFHAVTLFGAPLTENHWFFLLIMLAPAVMTMALVPGQWRHPVRWLMVFAVVVITDPIYTALTLITVESWALIRSWILEDGGKLFAARVRRIVTAARKSAASPPESA